jgi:hypothetical protein
MDLINIANNLYQYLLANGITFTNEGYPIISKEMLLRDMPEYIIPLGQTYAAKDKSKTLLVSFFNDTVIYKSLLSLTKDIPKYKEYLGFGGFDLSPRINWDINLQKFNILINKLADAYLAVNGVKIMPNFRTGSLNTFDVLSTYPANSWFTVGALGCSNGHYSLNELYLREKIIITNPNMLLYYGKLLPIYQNIIDEFGIDYKVFPDFQRVSRKEVA